MPFEGRHARGLLNLDIRTMAEFIASLDVSRTIHASRSHHSAAVEVPRSDPVEIKEPTSDASWCRWPSDAYWVPDRRGGTWKRCAIRKPDLHFYSIALVPGVLSGLIMLPTPLKQLPLLIHCHWTKPTPRTHLPELLRAT